MELLDGLAIIGVMIGLISIPLLVSLVALFLAERP
jgi:hypothetical protein